MARRTNEEIIIDLIIQEKGVAKSIGSLNTFDQKVKATVGWLQSLAQQSGKTVEQVSSAMGKLNDTVQIVEPGVLSSASVKAKQAAEATAHAERMRQIKEEEEAEKLKATKIKNDLAGIRAAEKKANAERKAEINAQKQQYDQVFDSYKSKINEILQLTPPSRQTRPLAQLAVEMEKVSKIPASETMKRLTNEMGLSHIQAQQLGREIEYVKNGFWGTAKAATNLGSVVNTVFGVVTAMAVFQVIQLVQNLVFWLGEAVTKANTLSQNILKLRTAEELMSVSGGDITPKDIEALVNRLNEKFVLTPRIDIISGLQRLSLEASQLGYGKKELEELMTSAMLIQIKQPEKSLDSIIEAMTTPLFGGSVKGAQALGFSDLNEDNIKRRARELGLVQDLSKELSAAARQQAIYSIIVDKTLAQEDSLLKAQENQVFSQQALNKTWQEFQEAVGSIFAPLWNNFLANVNIALAGIVEGLVWVKESLQGIMPYLLMWQDISTAIYRIVTLQVSGIDVLFAKIGRGIEAYRQDLAATDLAQAPDTPTGTGAIISAEETTANVDKVGNEIQRLIEWLDDLGDKAREMQEDFDRATREMVYDFEQIDIPRFMEDWAIDRKRLIEESNRDIEQANQDHLDREYWEYLKFQEKMRQLREKYLFSLEDALRERDARVVLRLGAQYQMDVTAATNEYNLAAAERAAQQEKENAERQAQLADKLARLDEERALELQRMKEDFDLKMKRREEEHRIDMERLQAEVDEKLRIVADSLAEELDLDINGANAIYNGLKNFYGGKGSIDNLFKYTYENLRNTTKSTYDYIMTYVKAYKDAADKMNQFQQQIYGRGYGQNLPHPGLYQNQSQSLPGVPNTTGSVIPSQVRTPSTLAGTIDVRLEEGLIASIVNQSVNEVDETILSVTRTRTSNV